MLKERVLIFDDHSERASLLRTSLCSLGYEVLNMACLNESDMQRKIHLYHPDYIVTEEDELISLRRH